MLVPGARKRPPRTEFDEKPPGLNTIMSLEIWVPLLPSPPTLQLVHNVGPRTSGTLSPGPASRPESSLDGPGAGKRPPEAENDERTPFAIFFGVATI